MEDRAWREMKRQKSQWIRDELDRIERETDARLDAMARDQQRIRDANEFGTSGIPDYDSIIRDNDPGLWEYKVITPERDTYDSGVSNWGHLFQDGT